MIRALRATDDGIATVLGLALAASLMAAGLVLAAVVSLAVGHQRASVAADLAALAGAARGCDIAERVARAHGAVSFTCRVEGPDAVVTVVLPAPAMLDRLAAWSGREAPVLAVSARAGRQS